MVDNHLLKALAVNHLPECPVEKLRVTKRLPYFRVDEKGQVWILGRQQLWLKVV
jgi:hypothetical protein